MFFYNIFLGNIFSDVCLKNTINVNSHTVKSKAKRRPIRWGGVYDHKTITGSALKKQKLSLR